ncbi:MAG: response regulator [Micavibrio sp.]|nr:MAG: response regulator [Micavibrio sp.]
MIIANVHSNKDVLVQLAPSIQAHMDEWQIVVIRTAKKDADYVSGVVKMLAAAYVDKDGLIVQKSDSNIVMLVRLGLYSNYIKLKHELEKHLPDHNSQLTVRKMSLPGLKQLKNELAPQDSKKKGNSDYEERMARRENIFMIADDDMFLRKTIATAVKKHGTVFEAGHGDEVLDTYKKCNPNILFLDIHMPGKNGLDTIDDIINADPSAFIVMISADSVKENILKAVEKGATTFLSKPPAKDKIMDILGQVPTIKL